MHLFCDESGNTGVDLLNQDQPVFALASTCLEGDVAEELLAPLLRRGQKEVKYGRLRGTALGQQALLSLMASPMLSVLNTKYTVADKVFYLVTHLVDKLIEPCMHEDGIDLYANDAHVGLARVWFYTGFTIFPGGHWKRVQRAFVEAIRRRTPTSFANFDAVLTAAFQSCPGEDDRLYGAGLMAARGRLPEFIGVYQDLEVFDPACDSFIALMQKWMKDVSGLFAVTHDRSKPMARNKTFLRTLMQPAPARVIGYRGRQGELPLRISTLDFADSRALPAVQLADVIAGAAADYVLAYSGRRPVTTYHEALKTSRLPELFVGGMLPEPSIERGPDPLPGERSLVDGATDFLSELGYFRKR